MFKIAICDDSDVDAGALSTALEKLRTRGIDYEEESYTNGLSLIKAYEAGARYHLIILDMLMEPLNGIDTAKFIRSMDLTVPDPDRHLDHGVRPRRLPDQRVALPHEADRPRPARARGRGDLRGDGGAR